MQRPLEVLRLYAPHAGTLASLLDSRAARAPQRECLLFEQRAISYAGLRERVGRAALMLLQAAKALALIQPIMMAAKTKALTSSKC